MDDSVLAALAKWPNVPHCYGWLALNRRGQWLLDGAILRHERLIAFIGRNYSHDEAGNWFFQNGPQRVYVELAYTPWVYRLDGHGLLQAHTGVAVSEIRHIWIDEAGNLLLDTELGPGLLEDRDLTRVLEAVHDASGAVADEATLLAALHGKTAGLSVALQGQIVPLGYLTSQDAPQRLKFIPKPQATASCAPE